MKVFFDTSVLIAASLANHVHHQPARRTLTRVKTRDDVGYASTHALAEMYAVMTRLPIEPQVTPEELLKIVEQDILPQITLVPLYVEDYTTVMRDLVARRITGARIYDRLHLRAAVTSSVDRIYTFNHNEWKKLAPDLAPIIFSPDRLPS